MKKLLAVCMAIIIMAMSSTALFADERSISEYQISGDIIIMIDPPGNG